MTDEAGAAAVQQEYTQLADAYETRWSRYLTATLRETIRRVRVHPGERVLDIGCGTGLLLEQLRRETPQAAYAGVDLCPAMLSKAVHRSGPSLLIVGDAAQLPFADRTFDLVVSTSSFHFWPNPLAGLREIARVLRPGGRAVITDWCYDYLTCKISDLVLRAVNSAHRRPYGSQECQRMLSEAGFAVRSVDRYRATWFWGMMTAVAEHRAA